MILALAKGGRPTDSNYNYNGGTTSTTYNKLPRSPSSSFLFC